MKKKLLVVEDEQMLAHIVKDSLQSKGFEVVAAGDGQEAWLLLAQHQFDCIVLDVMLPEMDGFTLIQKIRANDKITPVIFLTARSQTQDVVKGFELGGNDYLRKPFSIEELIARINALISRNVVPVDNETCKIGKFIFQYQKQLLLYDDQVQTMSHREAEILYRLYGSKNQVLERKQVLLDLWGDDTFFNARSMDVFISKLRKYLSQDPQIQIVNVRGIGYKLIS
ncbi:MAG: response regulator transcription factor [Saprospiraceae bacterium]